MSQFPAANLSLITVASGLGRSSNINALRGATVWDTSYNPVTVPTSGNLSISFFFNKYYTSPIISAFTQNYGTGTTSITGPLRTPDTGIGSQRAPIYYNINVIGGGCGGGGGGGGCPGEGAIYNNASGGGGGGGGAGEVRIANGISYTANTVLTCIIGGGGGGGGGGAGAPNNTSSGSDGNFGGLGNNTSINTSIGPIVANRGIFGFEGKGAIRNSVANASPGDGGPGGPGGSGGSGGSGINGSTGISGSRGSNSGNTDNNGGPGGAGGINYTGYGSGGAGGTGGLTRSGIYQSGDNGQNGGNGQIIITWYYQ